MQRRRPACRHCPVRQRLADLPPGVLAGGGALLGTLLLGSIGTAQWLVLRRHVRGAALWIPANAAAWTAGLAVCFAVIAFTAEGRPVAVNMGIGVLAGLGMGATVAAVTGVALVRLLDGSHRRSAGPPRWVNRLVGSVLRSPAHRLVSDSLALLIVRGRRTGTPVTVPVMYARTGDDLIVLVGDAASKQWWRNVQGGADIILLLGGHTRAARADILTEEDARSRALTSYLERFPPMEAWCGRWAGPDLAYAPRLRPAPQWFPTHDCGSDPIATARRPP